MPSALDLLIQQGNDAVIGDGKMFQLGEIESRGVTMPIISNAPANLNDYFAFFCHTNADVTFLVEGEERLTFGDVYVAAKAAAEALVSGYGLKVGDRVGIAMRNAPSWIVAYMATLMAGGVATLLNGFWQGAELVAGIRDVGCTLVLADAPRAKRIAESGVAHDSTIITLDLTQPIAQAMAPVTDKGGAGTPLPTLTPDDKATILFTSGSTGQSKGAWSTHRAVVQGVFNYIVQTATVAHVRTASGTPPEGQASTLRKVPLFHVTGEVPVLLQSFAIGRKLVLMAKWDAEEAMRLIEREKITYFVGVPLMSYEMLIHPNRDKYDLSSCQSFAAGGAPRPKDHVRRISEGMGGGQPILGYGLTETNGVGAGNLNENYLAKPDSTGPASPPLCELAIIDDAGKVLPQGEIGEVSIRSICNFSGYWNNDAATAAAYTADARFRTGDLGYLDEDGYLFIVDRKKDIIIRGGENISCPEVEAGIYAYELVDEAAVFGLPDEKFGEIVGAVVHFQDDKDGDIAGLRAYLTGTLAAYKVPAVIWESRDPLPVLGTGKLDRVQIRNSYRAQYAAEKAAN